MALTARCQTLLLLACVCAYPQEIITTLAGTDFTFPSQPIVAKDAPLAAPSSVASDATGNLYAMDTANNLILRITTDGTLTVLAGNGTKGFSGDGGLATSASLYLSPGGGGIAVDPAGNVYFADGINQRIRKVSTDGTITTVAGNGTPVSLTGPQTPPSSGDGGPATNVALAYPSAVALDSAATSTSATHTARFARSPQAGSSALWREMETAVSRATGGPPPARRSMALSESSWVPTVPCTSPTT